MMSWILVWVLDRLDSRAWTWLHSSTTWCLVCRIQWPEWASTHCCVWAACALPSSSALIPVSIWPTPLPLAEAEEGCHTPTGPTLNWLTIVNSVTRIEALNQVCLSKWVLLLIITSRFSWEVTPCFPTQPHCWFQTLNFDL